MNYYELPAELKPGQARMEEHTDFSSITLLYQDPAGGLEVLITLHCTNHI